MMVVNYYKSKNINKVEEVKDKRKSSEYNNIHEVKRVKK